MIRYWASWYTSLEPRTPFQYWITGVRCSDNAQTICALIDASSEKRLWEGVRRYFPDLEERFCEARPLDWQLGDRFTDFRNETSLEGKAHNAKPLTPAELLDIEKYGDLREVTAERLVATIKARDGQIDLLKQLIKAKELLLTAYRLDDSRRADRALTEIERIEAKMAKLEGTP